MYTMNNYQNDLRLLPLYFKKIAFGIMGLSILFATLKITNVLPFEKELVKAITLNGLINTLVNNPNIYEVF